jgi:hypothetical protein
MIEGEADLPKKPRSSNELRRLDTETREFKEEEIFRTANSITQGDSSYSIYFFLCALFIGALVLYGLTWAISQVIA